MWATAFSISLYIDIITPAVTKTASFRSFTAETLLYLKAVRVGFLVEAESLEQGFLLALPSSLVIYDSTPTSYSARWRSV